MEKIDLAISQRLEKEYREGICHIFEALRDVKRFEDSDDGVIPFKIEKINELAEDCSHFEQNVDELLNIFQRRMMDCIKKTLKELEDNSTKLLF